MCIIDYFYKFILFKSKDKSCDEYKNLFCLILKYGRSKIFRMENFEKKFLQFIFLNLLPCQPTSAQPRSSATMKRIFGLAGGSPAWRAGVKDHAARLKLKMAKMHFIWSQAAYFELEAAMASATVFLPIG